MKGGNLKVQCIYFNSEDTREQSIVKTRTHKLCYTVNRHIFMFIYMFILYILTTNPVRSLLQSAEISETQESLDLM